MLGMQGIKNGKSAAYGGENLAEHPWKRDMRKGLSHLRQQHTLEATTQPPQEFLVPDHDEPAGKNP